MAAMMGLLLHEEEHREQVWAQLPWLLGQYQQVQDTFRVTKVRCHTAEGGQRLPLLVQAVRSVLRDPSRKVARAVLRFTKELLSCSVQSCSAWDLVAHVFATFSQASGRLAQGNLSRAEAQEATDLQALCLDILGSVDVSVRGMTKLLWPRLLQYVVPAQYTGTLVPLSQCLRELAERRQRRLLCGRSSARERALTPRAVTPRSGACGGRGLSCPSAVGEEGAGEAEGEAGKGSVQA
nr:PREDICTED: maestro heat-like repeat-containing protein family member 2B [Struthio camelus australis]